MRNSSIRSGERRRWRDDANGLVAVADRQRADARLVHDPGMRDENIVGQECDDGTCRFDKPELADTTNARNP